MRLVLTLLSTLAIVLPAARAQDDKLPEGAIMRLGDLRWRFAEHSAEARRYAWLPDSSGIVACGKETIRLFDARTGRVIRDWKGDRGDCFMSVAVSPDGKTLAATKLWGLVYLWDIATGKKLKVLAPDGGIRKEHYVDHSAWSPDGKRLVTGRHAVQLWDVEKEKLLRVWEVRSDVDLVGFERDGTTLFTLVNNHIVRCSAESDRPVSELLIHEGSPRCVNGAGTVVAINREDDALTFWHAKSGHELGKIAAKFKSYHKMTFSSNGEHLWTAWGPFNYDATQWEVPSGRVVKSFALLPKDCGVPFPSPDGRKLALLSNHVCMSVYDIQTGKRLNQWPGHINRVGTLALSPGRDALLSGGPEGDLWLWHGETGRSLSHLAKDHYGISSIATTANGGEFLVGGIAYMGLRAIDAQTGKEARCLWTKDSKTSGWTDVEELCVLSQSEVLARVVRSNSKQLVKLEIETGKQLSVTEIGDRSETSFAGNGAFRIESGFGAAIGLAPAGTGQVIAVRDSCSNRSIWHRPLASNEDVSLAASPAGQTVATASTHETWTGNYNRRDDSYLQVWDLATSEERVRVTRNASIAWEGFGKPLFSPNGRVIVATWGGRTLLFFDALTGRELGHFKHDIGLNPLAFTRDGKRLATGVADGTILIWDVGKFTFQTKTRHLSQVEIEMSWRDLAGEIRPSVEAMARLEESPAQALALFRERLKPVQPIPVNKFQPLIGDLQAPEFAKRENATRELARYGERAHPALRSALSASPPAESRKRLETLLADPYLVKSPEIRRHLRAIELTAALDTPEAKTLLAEWAKGDPEARETQAAKMALER